MKKQHIERFVITGGPCSGKTTGLAVAMQKLKDYGVHALIAPEVATLFFTHGVVVKDMLANNKLVYQLQRRILLTQMAIEAQWLKMARVLPYPKRVLIMDRGAMDNKAYMDPDIFEKMIRNMGFSIADLRDLRYDAVFHMVTAAQGAEKFYNLDNPARYEKPGEARALDKRLLAAWTGHEHLRILSNFSIAKQGKLLPIDFKTKIANLMKELCRALHIPVPLEIERRFLVKLKVNPAKFPVHSVPADIIQTYLTRQEKGPQRRVRERRPISDSVADGGFVYTYTEKQRINSRTRQERERIITEREYLQLLAERDPKREPVRKRRHAFVYKNQYFQLDLLREPMRLAMLEIELTEENDKLKLPPFVGVVREVTEDDRYGNGSIAAGLCPGYK